MKLTVLPDGLSCKLCNNYNNLIILLVFHHLVYSYCNCADIFVHFASKNETFVWVKNSVINLQIKEINNLIIIKNGFFF